VFVVANGKRLLEKGLNLLLNRLPAFAVIVYVLGVVIGNTPIPRSLTSLAVCMWLIVACFYLLAGCYLLRRKMVIEGSLILMLCAFAVGMMAQQLRMLRLYDSLRSICRPIKLCKLVFMPYEHPRMMQVSADVLDKSERVIWHVKALVLKVDEEDSALGRLEGHSILVGIKGLLDEAETGEPLIELGKVVSASGSLSLLPDVSNPHQPNTTRRLLMEGVVARFTVDVHDFGHGKGQQVPMSSLKSWKAKLTLLRMRIKERLFERMRSWLPVESRDEAMSVIGSMFLGMHAAHLPSEIADVARRSGVIHILVVSGLHVTFIAMLASRLVSPNSWLSILLGLIAAFCYWLISYGEPSITRAVLMFSYVTVGSSFSKMRRAPHFRADWMMSLCFAGVIMVAMSPASLFNIGFQLSFVATFGILWLGGSVINAFMRCRECDERTFNLRQHVGRLMWYPSATVGAQVMISPLMAYHFNKLVLAGFVSNLVIVPLALVMLTLSIASAMVAGSYEVLSWASEVNMLAVFMGVLSSVVGFVGRALMWVNSILAGWLVHLMTFFATLPFSTLDVRIVDPMSLVAIYALIVALPMLPSVITRTRASGKTSIAHALRIILVVALLCMLFQIAGKLLRVVNPCVAFWMLDVGQGQCIFVRAPNDRCMLVDAGTMSLSGTAGDMLAKERILPFLYRERVHQIDVLVITHPDEDHVSALPAILERIPVGIVLDPSLPSSEPSYLRALSIIAERHISRLVARRGQRIVLDSENGVYADVLAPSEPLLRGTRDDVNNNVIVLSVNALGRKILLTSDMMNEQEEHLLSIASPTELYADVLYVPHHGSSSSCGEELLLKVKPKIALISCGRFNPFGHPSSEVIDRLNSAGVQAILRTDEHGAILLRITKRGITTVKFGRRW
jgi:competence protein ComEC